MNPRITKGYVDTAEGQVHFRQAGQGEPLLLLHQAPGSSCMWSAMLPMLAALGHRAIAFDLPGYGASDAPAEAPDLSDYARRIESAAVAMGFEQFDVVGHHTGSSVALWMAARPARRVRRIVAYGLAVLDAKTAAALAEEAEPDYGADGAEVMAWWNTLMKFVPAAQARTLVPRYLADMLLSGAIRASGHRAVGRADHATVLRALTVPLLAVAGRREMLYETTKAAVGLSPLIEFHELGDAGIFAPDEAPESFVQVIDDFLRC